MCQWTCCIDSFNSSHNDPIFHDCRYVYRISVLIDRDN